MTHAEFIHELTADRRAFDDMVTVVTQRKPSREEQEAAYEYACDALALLDPDPNHFRYCQVDGRCCDTLGEVVRALQAVRL